MSFCSVISSNIQQLPMTDKTHFRTLFTRRTEILNDYLIHYKSQIKLFNANNPFQMLLIVKRKMCNTFMSEAN